MIRPSQSFFIVALFTCILQAQVILEKPLSPRIANYKIDATLDTDEKVLNANEQLFWRNGSDKPIRELQFHLYMNAFRNKTSTFLKKIGLRHRGFGRVNEENLGGIDIHSIVLNKKVELTDKMEFIRPDDGNEHDSTVVRILLPFPVQPGEVITIDIGFETRLPEIIARTGYTHDYFLLGQWFPKIGVLVDGKWNCHQFHTNGEFFADFGVYEVKLSLPKKFIVGATGVLLKEDIGDSLKTLTFRAEDVHDFAITAWPKFLKEDRKIGKVQVSLLYAPEHSGNIERYFETINATMKYFEHWLIPYPYPNLTLVDMPLFAFRSAGMEYPCFITCGSIWGVPKSIKLFPEEVTVHEFSHQYFYGIIASNESEEPWLDEGFTSYATLNIMTNKYGLHRSLSTILNIERGQLDGHKKGYLKRPDLDYVVKFSWEFKMGGYGTYAYHKSVLILKTLENYLGEEVMTKVMREYITRWKFKHPRTRDFIAVVNDIAPENMDWFFDQALFGTEILDYSVENISSRRERIEKKLAKQDTTETLYESTIQIRRRGTFIFPVEIAAIFADEDTVIHHWDGKDSYEIITLQHGSELVAVIVDPNQKVWLDINWTNNSKVFRDNQLAFRRHWLKSMKLIQQMLLSFWSF